MLICPNCKFQNPDGNKFCQNCGTSMPVWWAIIAKVGNREWEGATALRREPPLQQVALGSGEGTGVEHRKQEQGEDIVSSAPGSESSSFGTPSRYSPLTVASYLDPQQRYQLLEPVPTVESMAENAEICVRVLDCQPDQISRLSTEQLGLANSSLADTHRIVDLAKPYIALQSKCNLGIPPIHDAWQEGDIQVVLIEDRSRWQHLLELWSDGGTNSLQIIHCFYQMTQLWALLETVNCRQSLLEWSNLRLDEDQAVALQRLYVEPLSQESQANSLTVAESVQEQVFTLPALGRIWQRLFRQSQRTQFGAIVQLLGEMEVDKIDSLTELQLRLQAIAADLQGDVPLLDSMNTAPLEKDIGSPTILQSDEREYGGVKSDDMPTVVLPMQLLSLEHAALTNVGRQRDHNEDCFGVEIQIHKLELPNNYTLQARGLYILCDGMGGHAGGEVASALAVNQLRQYFQTHFCSDRLPTEEQICSAVYQANQAIYDINQQDARSGVSRMGTTLVMMLIQQTQVAVAHVGDSRLYRLTRKGKLEQVTLDHEVGQREISRGTDKMTAYSRADAYQLTQALGPRDESFINPDVQFLEINEDTLFLLTSDGLSDNDLVEHHWQTHLEPLLSSGANLENGVGDLIKLANNYNGHDNITAIVIRAKVRPNLETQ